MCFIEHFTSLCFQFGVTNNDRFKFNIKCVCSCVDCVLPTKSTHIVRFVTQTYLFLILMRVNMLNNVMSIENVGFRKQNPDLCSFCD